MSEESAINVKLDFIVERCKKFEKFVDNFDEIFNIKYEARRKECPGYLWCEDGVKEFYKLKTDYGLHIQKHDTIDSMNQKSANNKKWIIGLLITALANFVFMVWKHISGKG